MLTKSAEQDYTFKADKQLNLTDINTDNTNTSISVCMTNIITTKSVCDTARNSTDTVSLDFISTIPISDYQIDAKTVIYPPQPAKDTHTVKVIAQFVDINGEVQNAALSYWTQNGSDGEISNYRTNKMVLVDGNRTFGKFEGIIPLDRLLAEHETNPTIRYTVYLEDNLNYTNMLTINNFSIINHDITPPILKIIDKGPLEIKSHYGESYRLLFPVLDTNSGINATSLQLQSIRNDDKTNISSGFEPLLNISESDGIVYEAVFASKDFINESNNYAIKVSDNNNKTNTTNFTYTKSPDTNLPRVSAGILSVDILNQTIQWNFSISGNDIPEISSNLNRSLPLRITYKPESFNIAKNISLQSTNSTNNKTILDFVNEDSNRNVWYISDLVSITNSGGSFYFPLNASYLRNFPFDEYPFSITLEIPVDMTRDQIVDMPNELKSIWKVDEATWEQINRSDGYSVFEREYTLKRDIENTNILLIIIPIFAVFALVGATPIIKTTNITERLALTLGVAALIFALQTTVNSVKPLTPVNTIIDFLTLSLIFAVVLFTIGSMIGWWLELRRPYHDIVATAAAILAVTIFYYIYWYDGTTAPLWIYLYVIFLSYGLIVKLYLLKIRHTHARLRNV
jgi:hypothetical protein